MAEPRIPEEELVMLGIDVVIEGPFTLGDVRRMNLDGRKWPFDPWGRDLRIGEVWLTNYNGALAVLRKH